MPYNPNANWTSRTDAAAKSPSYYLAIEGLTTRHYSTAPVRSAAVTKKILLNVPESIGQKLSQLQGRSTLSLMSVDLVDALGEITDLIATEKSSPTVPTLVNARATLYSGYMDLAEADFAPVTLAQVNDVRVLSDGETVRLTLVDLKRHQNEEAFTNAEATTSVPINTKFLADASVGAVTISVQNTTGFADDDKAFLGPSTDAGYIGGEEKVEILKIVGTTLFLKSALTKAYKINDEVRWATTVIQGNPMNMIYAVWTGDFASGSFPLTKVRGLPTGVGVAAADVDTTAIAKERDNFYGDEEWSFEIQNPTAGFRFLEQKLFRYLGMPFVRIDGKLSFRCFRPEYPDVAAAGLPTITQGDIIEWELIRDFGLHVNRIRLGVDLDPETGKPAERVTVEDTADQTATKEIAAIEDDETGMRAILRGVRLAEERGQVLLRRYLLPPLQIRVTCPLTKRALQVGEVVSLTHPGIPNPKTGTRGFVAVRMEIVEREERFRDERVVLMLQDPRFTRPAFIAPDAAPDYDAASAADKEYAYIAPDAGNFADGGVPYEII